MLAGILAVVGATAMFALVLTVVFYGATIRRGLVRTGRSAHLLHPEPPRPLGPPIDALARDLRRLRAATLVQRQDRSNVQRTATLAAYDDALIEACAALEIPDTLGDLPHGTEREAERLRIEWLLEQRGLYLG